MTACWELHLQLMLTSSSVTIIVTHTGSIHTQRALTQGGNLCSCKTFLIHANYRSPDAVCGSIFLHKVELKFQINGV